MQQLNCTVAIGGDAGMTVLKERVTVPEVMILRAVHGEDAVRNIEVIGEVDFTAFEERERLAGIYKSPETIVRDVLGANGSLPATLEDSNIPEEFIINAPAKKGGRKKSATVELDDTKTE